MALSQAQRTEAQDDKKTFTNKPVMLLEQRSPSEGYALAKRRPPARNGIPNVAIERSLKRDGSEEWDTQKVSLNAQDLLAMAGGLEKGHDAIVEKQVGKQQGQGRN